MSVEPGRYIAFTAVAPGRWFAFAAVAPTAGLPSQRSRRPPGGSYRRVVHLLRRPEKTTSPRVAKRTSAIPARVAKRAGTTPAGVANLTGLTTGGVAKAVDLASDGATALLFLTSSCLECRAVWSALGAMRSPPERLVIVTPDPATEDVAALRALAPLGIDVIMSSAAWLDLCPGPAPWLVVIAGGYVTESRASPTSPRRLARLLPA